MSNTNPEPKDVELDTFEQDAKSRDEADKGTQDSLGIDNTDTALAPEDTDDPQGPPA